MKSISILIALLFTTAAYSQIISTPSTSVPPLLMADDSVVALVDTVSPPGFKLFKRADQTIVTPPGSVVTYTYTVTNTGGITISNLTVTDDNGTPGLAADDFVVGVVPMLLPGAGIDLMRSVILPIYLCDAATGLESGVLITEVLPDGNIQATFIQDFGVNDNTYGANTIGWSRDHTFRTLIGSDEAQFQFKNAAGEVVLEFKLDYLSAAPPSAQFPAGYRSLGVTGGDGGMIQGSASSVLSWTTSLEQNLNKAPFLGNLDQYTVDSPALSDPNSSLWEYRMIYSVVVDRNSFGPAGFGSAMITGQHNSPAKRNVQGPVPCGGCVTNVATAVADADGITLNDSAIAVVCSGSSNPPPGNCPYSPSYWKHNHSAWPAGYSPDQTVESVFAAASIYPDAASATLRAALGGQAGRGGVSKLLKQAMAALFNAASPNLQYPLTPSEVIQAVNMALTNGDTSSLTSLADLFHEANKKYCGSSPGNENCDTEGRPNVLTLIYTGQSCAEAFNSQMDLPNKTFCSGDPADAPSVRIIASERSTEPTSTSPRYFDALVSLSQMFEVSSAYLDRSRFGQNVFFHIYNGTTLVQTIQIHTSCSAPLRRGETFGSLMLVRVEP